MARTRKMAKLEEEKKKIKLEEFEREKKMKLEEFERGKKMKTSLASLPDHLIDKILSYLPLKESFKNAALVSKQWDKVVTSLSCLNFDVGDFLIYQDFYDALMFFLNDRSSVQSFTLTSTYELGLFGNHNKHAIIILRSLAKKHLTVLDFTASIPLRDCPFSRFTDLVTLRLRNTDIKDTRAVCFPALRTLELQGVSFLRLEYLIQFLRGCSMLESLTARFIMLTKFDLRWYRGNIELPLPNLINAKLEHCYLPLELCANGQRLVLNLDNTLAYDYMPGFQNLVQVDLCFKSTIHNLWDWTVHILHNMPKLQKLIIRNESLLPNEVGEVADEYLVPNCLSSNLLSFTLKYFKGMEHEVQFAKYILQNAKVLRSMTIHTILFNLKHPILEAFYSSPKGSVTCNLHFDIEQTV